MPEIGERIEVRLKWMPAPAESGGERQFVFGTAEGIEGDVMVHVRDFRNDPNMDAKETFLRLRRNYVIRGILQRNPEKEEGEKSYFLSDVDLVVDREKCVIFSANV